MKINGHHSKTELNKSFYSNRARFFPGGTGFGCVADCRDVLVTNCLIHDVDGGMFLYGKLRFQNIQKVCM